MSLSKDENKYKYVSFSLSNNIFNGKIIEYTDEYGMLNYWFEQLNREFDNFKNANNIRYSQYYNTWSLSSDVSRWSIRKPYFFNSSEEANVASVCLSECLCVTMFKG